MVPFATLVLLHADVRTMDEPARAEAIAIRDGIVVAVGDTATVSTFIGPDTLVQDLGGRVVLPGFVDAGVHLVGGGVALGRCRLDGAVHALDVARQLRGCGGGDDWLIGGGWGRGLYSARGPRAADLDALFPGRPVVLWSSDGGAAWVSSDVLRRAHITAKTPDPPGGRIERYPDGAPSGTLRGSAMDRLDRVLPRTEEYEVVMGLRRGVAEANRHGVTTVLEADVDLAALRAWREMKDLTVRATLALDADQAEVRRLIRQRSSVDGPWLRADTAAIVVDGRDAVTPADRGPAPLSRRVRDLAGAGFRVHARALGDGAVDVTLDAMQSARDAGATATFSIAAPGVLPDDPRLDALDVAALVATRWAFDDSYVHTPPDRPSALTLYPVGSLRVVPVEHHEPAVWIQGVEVAPAGPEEPPAEAPAIDVEAALWAMTRGAAEAIGRGDDAGRIAPGRPADLVVLRQDPDTLPAAEAGRVYVQATLFAGEVVAGSL